MKKFLAICLISLIIAGCSGGSKTSAPSGYKQMTTQTEEGVTSTTYSGSGSKAQAEAAFKKWLGGQGWQEVDLEDAGDFLDSIGVFTGIWFEKGDDVLLLFVFDLGSMVQVTTTKSARD